MSWAADRLQAVTQTQEESQTHCPLALCHAAGSQSSGMGPQRHFSNSQGLLVF